MNEQSTYDADEISLTDIVLKLWRRRGLIVLLPLLAGGIGLIAVLVMATKVRMPIVYYLNLTGIEKGDYPNGVAFSPKDLEAPEVLSALATRMGVKDNDDLRSAISNSRLSAIQTSDGITPADLKTKIVNFNNIYLSAILSRNLGADDALTRYYQQDLLLKIEKVNEEIRGVNESIQSIQLVLNGESTQPTDRPTYQSDRVQVTGDAIGDIVQLVNRSSLADFLTRLYEQKGELILARANLNMQAKKINNKVEFTGELINSAQVQLDRLNETYINLLVRAREMNRQNSGTLYQGIGEPVKIGSMLPGRSFLIIVLSVLIGGFVAVMLALILPVREGKSA